MREQTHGTGPVPQWKALVFSVVVNAAVFIPLAALYLSMCFILFGSEDLDVAIDDFLFGAPIGAIFATTLTYFLIRHAPQRISQWILTFAIFVPSFTVLMLLIQDLLDLPDIMVYLPMQTENMFGNRDFAGSFMINIAISLPIAIINGFMAWGASQVLIRSFASKAKA